MTRHIIGLGAARGWRLQAAAAALLALCIIAAPIGPAAQAANGRGIPSVSNPSLLKNLDAAQRAALARNGFVVTAPARMSFNPNNGDLNGGGNDPKHPIYWQFFDLYQENFAQQIPNFITSDVALHTFHIMYDQTLVALERNVLADKLRQFSSGLVASALYQYGATGDPKIKAAARLNLGYTAVAMRLLDPTAQAPAPVASPVAQELALIAAHRGLSTSPLFGYAVDYSKFVPRGHYAGDATLSRYFQAMTWYGLLTFHLNGPDSAVQTRQAILLVRSVTRIADLKTLWAQIFDPITTWVGRSDDLTVRDYVAVMSRVYKSDAPVSALSDDAALRRFTALANTLLPDPQIRDELAASSKGAVTASKGLRLFGQRFVPDEQIMQSLIWDNVGTAQHRRVWTTGLDVASGLGSQRAASVAAAQGETRYDRYVQQLDRVQASFVKLPAAAWQQNLYWDQLNTLRAVWGAPPPAAPSFMKTDAWATKSLAAGLGAWAELRHDTLLYVKQVSGLGGGGGGHFQELAYVEPIPLVYQRLLAATQQLKATLAAEGILDKLPQPIVPFSENSMTPPLPAGDHGYRGAFDAFARILALLEKVSERELLGQPVAQPDLDALATIHGPLELLTMFFQDNGANKQLLFRDAQVASIADVFTEPGSGKVLEVGVGDVVPLYAVVTINGRRWLARGGAYSYYEFHWPMSDRLTDNSWRQMTQRPALPSWVSAYMAY